MSLESSSLSYYYNNGGTYYPPPPSSLRPRSEVPRVEPPVGMRFLPTDQELITAYLRELSRETYKDLGLISWINIYKHEPRELPSFAYDHRDGRMYFFTWIKNLGENKKERIIESKRGTWKTSQAAKPVKDFDGVKIGEKVSLVYYVIKDDNTRVKTDWLMTEYRLLHPLKVNDWELVLVVIYYHQKAKNRIT